MSFVVSRVSQFHGFGFIGFVEGFILIHVGFVVLWFQGLVGGLRVCKTRKRPGTGCHSSEHL